MRKDGQAGGLAGNQPHGNHVYASFFVRYYSSTQATGSLSLYPLPLFAFVVSFVFSLLSLLVCFFFAIFVLYSACRTCVNLRGWVEMCDKQFPPGNRPAECQQRPSSSCSRPAPTAPRLTLPRPAFSFLFSRPFSFSLASNWRGVVWHGVVWRGVAWRSVESYERITETEREGDRKKIQLTNSKRKLWPLMQI